jgi:hypothetical protein
MQGETTVTEIAMGVTIMATACQLTETCVFFNGEMTNMPAATAVYKQIYCQDDFDNCARYYVLKALGRENVPADLFPNQILRAGKIILR